MRDDPYLVMLVAWMSAWAALIVLLLIVAKITGYIA